MNSFIAYAFVWACFAAGVVWIFCRHMRHRQEADDSLSGAPKGELHWRGWL
jgi:hypothetical protein